MYNYYPDEIIEEVRINNDIVNVVSDYVKLDKKGKYLFGLCPFHKEKTGSFSVTPSKQIFYCYSCGKGGNVYQFIMGVENLSFIDAVKFLADRANVKLPEGESKEEQERARLKKEVISINTEAARFFYEKLNSKENQKARDYLIERSLSEQVLRKFGLGYSPHGWDILYKYLLTKGFEETAIASSGLVLKDKNGRYYDRFRNRIMFPIFDVRGNIIGFGGRVIDDSMPKYMNSPETVVYNKGKNLYGLNFAKNSGQKKIIIVEGYMDVISLHQFGIINTVASLGTALTESQGRLLKMYGEEVIISFDADVAGQAATIRGLDILNDVGCNVRVLMIPKGKDPDEYIKVNGPDGFKKLIDNAISLIEYKIKVLKNLINTDTTEGRIKFLNKTASLLSKIDNSIEREMYIKKLSKDYGISEESLYAEIHKLTKPKTQFRPTSVNVEALNKSIIKRTTDDNENKVVYYERMLLALISTDNSIYKSLKDKFYKDYFTYDENKRISEIVIERLENNKGIRPAELLNIIEAQNVGVFTRIIEEDCNFEDNKKAFLDIIKKIETFKIDKRQHEILELLKDTSKLSSSEMDSLKTELQSIIMQKKVL